MDAVDLGLVEQLQQQIEGFNAGPATPQGRDETLAALVAAVEELRASNEELRQAKEVLEAERRYGRTGAWEPTADTFTTSEPREHDVRLVDVERRKSEFLHIASHELGSPLAIIRGYLTMLLARDFGDLSPEAERAVATALEQCRSMAGLVDRMLDTERAATHTFPLAMTRIDLRAITGAAVGAAVSWDPDLARLEVSAPDVPVPVRGDPEQLVKALAALIENALKYSPPPTPVRCEVQVDTVRGTAGVVVSDGGIGLGSEQRDRLFQPFGRVVTSQTSHILGSGLGLYLAREIARLHGGDVDLVASAPGAGSTFALTLPLALPGDIR